MTDFKRASFITPSESVPSAIWSGNGKRPNREHRARFLESQIGDRTEFYRLGLEQYAVPGGRDHNQFIPVRLVKTHRLLTEQRHRYSA